jgi:hypothetical protein
LWSPQPAQADLIAGWTQPNSSSSPSNFLALSSHPKLAAPSIMNWKPGFIVCNDPAWFAIEPWTTLELTNGIAPSTNNLPNNPSFGSAVGSKSPPFIEFRFTATHGYKTSITNMLWQMQNDELRLHFVMRSSVDGYRSNVFVRTGWPAPVQTDLTVQHSTN